MTLSQNLYFLVSLLVKVLLSFSTLMTFSHKNNVLFPQKYLLFPTMLMLLVNIILNIVTVIKQIYVFKYYNYYLMLKYHDCLA